MIHAPNQIPKQKSFTRPHPSGLGVTNSVKQYHLYTVGDLVVYGMKDGPIKVKHLPTGMEAVSGTEVSQYKNVLVAAFMIESGLIKSGHKEVGFTFGKYAKHS